MYHEKVLQSKIYLKKAWIMIFVPIRDAIQIRTNSSSPSSLLLKPFASSCPSPFFTSISRNVPNCMSNLFCRSILGMRPKFPVPILLYTFSPVFTNTSSSPLLPSTGTSMRQKQYTPPFCCQFRGPVASIPLFFLGLVEPSHDLRPYLNRTAASPR